MYFAGLLQVSIVLALIAGFFVYLLLFHQLKRTGWTIAARVASLTSGVFCALFVFSLSVLVPFYYQSSMDCPHCVPAQPQLDEQGADESDYWLHVPESWQAIISRLDLPELPQPGLSIPSSYKEENLENLLGLCVRFQGRCENLFDLGIEIDRLLADSGYPRVAHFYGTDGIPDLHPTLIFVAPPELIFADGRPAEINRFDSMHPYSLREYSIPEFIRVMFNGYEGYLRVVVVAVFSDQIHTRGPDRLSIMQMEEAARLGGVNLHSILKSFQVDGSARVATLAYEFNAPRGSVPMLVRSSSKTRAILAKLESAMKEKG